MLNREAAFNQNFKKLYSLDKKIMMGLLAPMLTLGFFRDSLFFWPTLIGFGLFQLPPKRSYLERDACKTKHDELLAELITHYRHYTDAGVKSVTDPSFIKLLETISPFVSDVNLLMPWSPAEVVNTQGSQAFCYMLSAKPFNVHFPQPVAGFFGSLFQRTQEEPFEKNQDKETSSFDFLQSYYCKYICGYGTQVSVSDIFWKVFGSIADEVTKHLPTPQHQA